MDKTITISNETYEKLKDQLGESLNSEESSLFIGEIRLRELVGKNIFFRTPSFHYLGKVVNVGTDFIHLANSSWVADSGRFSTAIREGKLKESEYVGEMVIRIGHLSDFIIWRHQLPMETI